MARIPPFVLLGLLLCGCCESTRKADRPVASASGSPGKILAERPTLLVELTGGHDSVFGWWHIVVSPQDGSLHVSKISPTGRATISPQDWRVSSGACVFIEGNQRVWAFDGGTNLFMLAAEVGSLVSYGPRHFPCALPDELNSRLPSEVRQLIRKV